MEQNRYCFGIFAYFIALEIAEEEAEEQIKLMNQREKFFDLKKFLKGYVLISLSI